MWICEPTVVAWPSGGPRCVRCLLKKKISPALWEPFCENSLLLSKFTHPRRSCSISLFSLWHLSAKLLQSVHCSAHFRGSFSCHVIPDFFFFFSVNILTFLQTSYSKHSCCLVALFYLSIIHPCSFQTFIYAKEQIANGYSWNTYIFHHWSLHSSCTLTHASCNDVITSTVLAVTSFTSHKTDLFWQEYVVLENLQLNMYYLLVWFAVDCPWCAAVYTLTYSNRGTSAFSCFHCSKVEY